MELDEGSGSRQIPLLFLWRVSRRKSCLDELLHDISSSVGCQIPVSVPTTSATKLASFRATAAPHRAPFLRGRARLRRSEPARTGRRSCWHSRMRSSRSWKQPTQSWSRCRCTTFPLFHLEDVGRLRGAGRTHFPLHGRAARSASQRQAGERWALRRLNGITVCALNSAHTRDDNRLRRHTLRPRDRSRTAPKAAITDDASVFAARAEPQCRPPIFELRYRPQIGEVYSRAK
jgi:hypothetical protein